MVHLSLLWAPCSTTLYIIRQNALLSGTRYDLLHLIHLILGNCSVRLSTPTYHTLIKLIWTKAKWVLSCADQCRRRPDSPDLQNKKRVCLPAADGVRIRYWGLCLQSYDRLQFELCSNPIWRSYYVRYAFRISRHWLMYSAAYLSAQSLPKKFKDSLVWWKSCLTNVKFFWR